MLESDNPYYRQVELVVRVLPLLAQAQRFALKGGTAINLFVRDMPRLSIDIDLVYLPLDAREVALREMEADLQVIAELVRRVIPGAKTNVLPGEGGHAQRFQVMVGGIAIKIEVSPVLRGSVLEPQVRPVMDCVADRFGYVEAKTLDVDELYAGKLVAALDRQHPRDLFDVMLLLENEGITPGLIEILVIYLVCSNRPIAELLDPRPQPLQPVFEQQFRGMTTRSVSVEELERARETLVETVRRSLSRAHREFLLSFKRGEPDWSLLEHAHAQYLPAVRWKLQNIQQLDAGRRHRAVTRLAELLGLWELSGDGVPCDRFKS